MPEALRSLLATGSRTIIDDAEQAHVVADEWHPPVVSDKQKAWIERKLLPDYDAYLAPANGDDLSARVTAYLLHFYVAKLSPGVHAKLVDDWVKALRDLPMWAVEEACTRWFDTDHGDRKPNPAHIRRLAKAAVADAAEERDKLSRILALPAPSNELVAALAGKLQPVAIDKWIAPLSLTVVDNVALVRCPSRFHRDWVRSHYATAIAQAQPGRKVHILGPGETAPKPEADGESREEFVMRLRTANPNSFGGGGGVPLYQDEVMSPAEKARLRQQSLRRVEEHA